MIETNEWTETMPTEPGQYDIRCMETDQEPSRVTVFDRDGYMMVDDPTGIGECDLKYFHDGLTDLEWRPAEASAMKTPPDDLKEAWPCACVRRDTQGNLTAIKLNHRTVNRCGKCKSDRPDEYLFGHLDFAEMASRLQDFLDGVDGVGATSVGVAGMTLLVYWHKRKLRRHIPAWLAEIGVTVYWEYVGRTRPAGSV